MKPNLILIPGWGFRSGIWKSVITALDYNCITLEWPEVIEKNGQKIIDILSGKKPAYLIGWSLGAITALKTVINLHTDKIKGLIIVSGTAKMTSSENYIGADPAAIDLMIQNLNTHRNIVLKKFSGLCFHPKAENNNEDLLLKNNIQTNELLNGLIFLRDTDIREQVKNIEIPALILHGQRDMVIPVKSAEYLSHSIKNSTIKIYPELGHALPITAPKLLADDIRTFINNGE